MILLVTNWKRLLILMSAVASGVVLVWLGSLVHAAEPQKTRAQQLPEVPTAILPGKHKFFLEDHCYSCHDNGIQKGKVNLEALNFEITTLEQAEAWQKILNAVNSGEMPPLDKKQPPQEGKASFLADLADTMVVARRVLSDAGGKITMRRLNRREYGNTVAQLLGVRIDDNALPREVGAGFDTTGSSLFISGDQIERYMAVARSAIDEAFERNANAGIQPKSFRIEPEHIINPINEKDFQLLDKRYQGFLEWKVLVDQAIASPENQKRIKNLRKAKPDLAKLPGRIYHYAHMLEGTPAPEDYGLSHSQRVWFETFIMYPYHKHYAALPGLDRGTYLMPSWGVGRIDLSPPAKDLPPGRYTLRIRAGVTKEAPQYRRYIEVGYPQRHNRIRRGLEGPPLSAHQVTGSVDEPSIIETQVEVNNYMPREFAIHERHPTDETALRHAFAEHMRVNGYGHPPAIWIDWIELVGPLPEDRANTTLEQVLEKHSDLKIPESRRARRILWDFARAAFRQAKPEAGYINRLVSIFESRRESGEPFNIAIRHPLSVILASPGFIYLSEPAKEDKRRNLTDREIAIRLSYFLWSGPPDDTLYELAKKNKLHQPEILEQQVDRMLADPRSDAFVSGFVHQWLDMERLDFFQFNPIMHREFDESTRSAAREEVYQSFAHLLRSNNNSEGRLGHLLNSNYVIINSLLATYYDIDGVDGDEFRVVQLPADSPRGGLLGMAAIHAMGSDGINSSPIERGAWVLRHLLHDPPPPAPPNVPQLSTLHKQVLTTKQRLSAHTKQAQCSSCHRKIDPIGFGMENFNAAGKWRTFEHAGPGKSKSSWKIDASGQLQNGVAFKDYFEFRDVIASKEDAFAQGLTESLIEYALGRPYGFTDAPLSKQIIEKAKREQYALREFILSVVQSEAFQSK